MIDKLLAVLLIMAAMLFVFFYAYCAPPLLVGALVLIGLFGGGDDRAK